MRNRKVTPEQLRDFEHKIGFVASIWREGYQEKKIHVSTVCNELRESWNEVDALRNKVAFLEEKMKEAKNA